jgi:phosphatidylglycerol:prolipoprotein diacylglycerol transferase
LHPILFSLGPFQVRAYGLALAVSFLLGSWLALRRGRPRGFKEDDLLGLFWWIVLASMIGARAHFVLGHPEDFARPLDALRIWDGGLTLYGGLIAAIAAAWYYLRRHRLAFLPVADVVAPSLALGEGITRIGCFVNGCCFGRACGNPLGIHYPPTSYAASALGAGVAVWPSQLFLSAGLLLSMLVLLWVDRRPRAVGAIFGLYLLFQGVARWAVDFTRYYEPIDRLSLGPLVGTKSQLVALLLAVAGIALLLRGRREQASGAETRGPA